jgi:hypothetical protein
VRPREEVDDGYVDGHAVDEGAGQAQVHRAQPAHLVHRILVQNDVLQVQGPREKRKVCTLQVRQVLLEGALDRSLNHVGKHFPCCIIKLTSLTIP